MNQINDVLTGLEPNVSEFESPSKAEIISMVEDNDKELRKAKKKLRKAKKKGKHGKKLKKKIKKLEAKLAKFERLLYTPTTLQPARGRWDSLIEKTVPEAIKFAIAVVDRTKPQPTNTSKRQVVCLSKNQTKYLPQNQPLCLQQGKTIYLQPSAQEDDI